MSVSLYATLDHAGDCFRLLQLHPGRKGEPLSAALLPVNLADPPDYEALSYVWGPPENQSSIVVGGESFSIRPSLFNFLAVLRQVDRPRLVYVDAICINQADEREKSHQVQIMGKIYKSATTVLAWLGSGSPDVVALFELARGLSADDFGPQADEGGQISWRRVIDSAPEIASLRNTLYEVMEQDYWKRAWIVQECLLAKDIVFCSAGAAVTWNQFLLAHMMLLGKPPVALRYTWSHLTPNITRFDHLAGERAHIGDYPQSLAHIVNKFNTTESTVPHDMVYAFFELIRESQPDHPGYLRVNYRMSTSSLYLRAGYAYLMDPNTGRPHRVLPSLRKMLRLTALNVLYAVCVLIDPEELLSPIDWIVGDWDPAETPSGSSFRTERKSEDLNHMHCHIADFTTLVLLLDAKEGRE